VTRPVLINGRWTLELPEHRAARPQWLIENGGWETERLDAMHVAITKGMTVFDVGSEEGDFPALFASWGAKVVLFEPNPLVWPNIKLIWDANQLGAPEAWFTGFASSETVLEPESLEPIFTRPAKDGWPACAYGPVIGDHGFRNVSERFHDTPQTRIDDYVAATGIRPDLLTLDVEGAELEVLRGATITLQTRQIPVFVSVHPDFMQDMHGYNDSLLHDFMASLGYHGQHLATDHEQHYLFS